MDQTVEEGELCWDTERSAAYINSTPATMQTWRSRGVGPPYLKGAGRKILYTRADLDAWLRARVRRVETCCGSNSAEIAGDGKGWAERVT